MTGYGRWTVEGLLVVVPGESHDVAHACMDPHQNGQTWRPSDVVEVDVADGGLHASSGVPWPQ